MTFFQCFFFSRRTFYLLRATEHRTINKVKIQKTPSCPLAKRKFVRPERTWIRDPIENKMNGWIMQTYVGPLAATSSKLINFLLVLVLINWVFRTYWLYPVCTNDSAQRVRRDMIHTVRAPSYRRPVEPVKMYHHSRASLFRFMTGILCLSVAKRTAFHTRTWW